MKPQRSAKLDHETFRRVVSFSPMFANQFHLGLSKPRRQSNQTRKNFPYISVRGSSVDSTFQRIILSQPKLRIPVKLNPEKKIKQPPGPSPFIFTPAANHPEFSLDKSSLSTPIPRTKAKKPVN